MKDDKYNGWANYETWLVKLHIDNNEDYYKEVWELAKEDKDCSDRELGTKIEAWLEDTVLADTLSRNYGNTTTQESNNNLVVSDLILAANRRVNFTEIAKAVREEL